MAIPPGVSPGASARSTAIPASGDGMFSGLLAGPDISNILSQAQGVSQPYAHLGIGHDPSQGQGMVSNIRHGVGTSLGRDAIAGWLDPGSISTGDPNWFARGAGNVGAWLGAAGSEVPDFMRAIRAGTPKPWVQPWEDILANTMGLKETDYFTSPETKAANLSETFANDPGIINTTLQGLFSGTTPSLAAGTIRSPFPPTNTTPTTERMIRALKNPLKVDVPRPTGGGGGLFAGLGGLLSGAAPAAAWGLGLPLGMMWPSKISEEQGIVPESGPLTHQQLFKMRNDAEDVRLREVEDPGLWDRFRGFFGRSSDPNIPDRPLWNPISAAGASTAPTSPDVIFNPPPVVPPISREQEIENMMMQDRIGQLEYLPGGSLYKAPFEQGTGPMASQVSQALADAAYGRPVQEELQSLAQLSKTDPGIAKRYVPGSQALQDITSQVESFADIPAVQPGAEKPWTPPAPAVPDISEILKTYVPPPAAQEPYVEQFEEITPPKKVVKKKVKKAKPGPKKEKKAKVSKTAVQKAVAPRRVKYTPPKPKSKTPVTRRKGGKPKVRRVSKAPRRPGGR